MTGAAGREDELPIPAGKPHRDPALLLRGAAPAPRGRSGPEKRLPRPEVPHPGGSKARTPQRPSGRASSTAPRGHLPPSLECGGGSGTSARPVTGFGVRCAALRCVVPLRCVALCHAARLCCTTLRCTACCVVTQEPEQASLSVRTLADLQDLCGEGRLPTCAHAPPAGLGISPDFP